MMPLLEVLDIEVFYGNVQVLHSISLVVEEGEIVVLLGSNGAGKSTVLSTISGLIKPRSGKIIFDGQRIDQVPGFTTVSMGISHVPEGRHIFPEMTVLENLYMGAYHSSAWVERKRRLVEIFHFLPILSDRRSQAARTLSGGEQQILSMGRGLMSGPRLLLLDEPSLGLAPNLANYIIMIMRTIQKEQGVAILLVEQNVHKALQIADRFYLLENGRIVLSGPSKELSNDPILRQAYLGL